MDVRSVRDHPQPLPELGLGDHLQGAALDGLPDRFVEPVFGGTDVAQGQPFFAQDDERGRGVRLVEHDAAVATDDGRGVAARHAGQAACDRHALALQNRLRASCHH